jgi:hypothetical protein
LEWASLSEMTLFLALPVAGVSLLRFIAFVLKRTAN